MSRLDISPREDNDSPCETAMLSRDRYAAFSEHKTSLGMHQKQCSISINNDVTFTSQGCLLGKAHISVIPVKGHYVIGNHTDTKTHHIYLPCCRRRAMCVGQARI